MLDCYYLDYTGAWFHSVYGRFVIDKFDNLQNVISLRVCPLEAAVKGDLISGDMLVERGRRFIQCTKPCHQYYSGSTHDRAPNGNKLFIRDADHTTSVPVYPETVESQVMVDFDRALQEYPD